VPLFQIESVQNFYMKMSLIFMKVNICRRSTLTCEWFQTETRFDTEAKANPEMAVYMLLSHRLSRMRFNAGLKFETTR